jgi:hypothetical protein
MAQTGDQVGYRLLELRESLIGIGLLRIPPSITKVTLSLGSLAGAAGGSAHATKFFHAASLTSPRSALCSLLLHLSLILVAIWARIATLAAGACVSRQPGTGGHGAVVQIKS